MDKVFVSRLIYLCIHIKDVLLDSISNLAAFERVQEIDI